MRVLQNRSEIGCPSCGQAFERLVVVDPRTKRFEIPPNGPFCLARTDDRLLLLTH